MGKPDRQGSCLSVAGDMRAGLDVLEKDDTEALVLRLVIVA